MGYNIVLGEIPAPRRSGEEGKGSGDMGPARRVGRGTQAARCGGGKHHTGVAGYVTLLGNKEAGGWKAGCSFV